MYKGSIFRMSHTTWRMEIADGFILRGIENIRLERGLSQNDW